MPAKKLYFVLFGLGLLLLRVAPALSLQLTNRIISLKELYREHKVDSDDSNTTGNFLLSTDGTVLFFASEKRDKFRQIVAGTLSETMEKFIICAKPYGNQRAHQLRVTKVSDTLKIGQFTVDQTELERVRLTSGWPEVLKFCREYVIDDSGAHLKLYRTSITRINKNEFLICGGADYIGYLISRAFNKPENIAQVFDSSTGRVVKVIPLAAKHYGNRSILLRDGTVLITGSDLPTLGDPTVLEVVDPVHGTSKLLHSRLSMEKAGSTLCLDFAGRCLIFPGQTPLPKQVNTIERVDPKTDKIEIVGNMYTPRWYMDNLNEVPENAVMLTKNLALVSGGSACSVHAEGMFQRRDAELVKIKSPD